MGNQDARARDKFIMGIDCNRIDIERLASAGLLNHTQAPALVLWYEAVSLANKLIEAFEKLPEDERNLGGRWYELCARAVTRAHRRQPYPVRVPR